MQVEAKICWETGTVRPRKANKRKGPTVEQNKIYEAIKKRTAKKHRTSLYQ